MAEGPWKVYQSYQEQGHPSADFSLTLCIGLVTNSYTPATSHSAWSQVVGNAVSASVTFTSKTLSGVDWTLSGSSTKLLADNINITSGDGMKARYGIIFLQTSGRLVCHSDLSAAGTTGVEANQINLTLGTIFSVRDSNGT